MAATVDTFFGNRGTISVVGSLTTDPKLAALPEIAVVKGVEVNVTFEHVELYGFGTILRADVAKHTAKVEVKLRWARFNPSLATFWPYWIMNPTATTPASGSIEDTNIEKMFKVTAVFTGTNGRTMTMVIDNVYFEGIPFPMPENDFVVLDLSGYGSAITITPNAEA